MSFLSDPPSDMESFFEGWLSRYEQLLSDLQSAARDRPDLARDLVNRTLAHYHEYYHEKSLLAARDVIAVFSPTWLTPYERTFLWIAGWKPSLAFRLLSTAVPALSAEQGVMVGDLRRATVAAERRLSGEMAQVQEAVASAQVLRAVRDAGIIGEGAADATVGRLGMLVGRADALRVGTVVGLVGILTPVQALDFFVAAATLQFRLRRWGGAAE